MIPAFNDSGVLPEGLHPATFDEIVARFGAVSELRRVQVDSVRWMVQLTIRSGITRIVLNGSFVTDTMDPNDVDCVLLAGPQFPKDVDAERELLTGLPFLDVAIVDQVDFDYFVNRFFAFDRGYEVKGMVEVLI